FITNSVPHRLNDGDNVFLTFTDTSGNVPPTALTYSITSLATNAFRVNAPGITTLTYGQVGTVLTVTNNGHGLVVSNRVYLQITSGGAASGAYDVVSVPNTNSFTVAAVDSASRTGSGLLPKWTGGGYTQTGTSINFSLGNNHGLNP